MKKKIMLQGLIIALLSLFITNSYGQITNCYSPIIPVKGTANAVWDSLNKRYLYSYQDISKDGTGKPVFNESSIYQCDRSGKNVAIFTNLSGQLLAPTGLLIKGNNLYIADWTKIWIVSLTDGTIVDQIMAPGTMGIQDIATDGVNTLYASDFLNSQIYYFNMTTKAYDTLNDPKKKISRPTGIYYVATPKPKLYITSFVGNSPIQCYDFTGDSFALVYPTSYQFCYSLIADTKGNYFLSDWKSTSANAGTVYKFLGGFSASLPFVQNLNFPADLFYQPIGDTLVVPELNSGKNTLKFVKADRDLIPPTADSSHTISANTIIVYFSEPVTSSSATDAFNYTNLGSFTSITLNAAKNQVTLVLTTPLTPNLPATLYVQNIKDLAGNVMTQAKSFNVTWKLKSIYDVYLKSGLTVSPNPAKNRFTISYDLLQPARVNIELYDIMGKQVANFYNGIQTPDNYNLNCQLPNTITDNGVYILKVTINGQIFMSRVLIDK
jgi:hypothetical protein